MTIPIRNVFHMLSYAWDVLDESGTIDVSSSSTEALPDLLARVLVRGVRHLVRRGLYRDYIPAEGEVAGVTGRIDFQESIMRRSFQRGRAYCHFDQFTHDVQENQIIQTAIHDLLRFRDLDASNRRDLASIKRLLADVRPMARPGQPGRRLTLHRNNRHYRLVLGVADLIRENRVPDESGDGLLFGDFQRDPKPMARLFEKFLYNFLSNEQDAFDVRRRTFRWRQGGGETDDYPEFLPTLKTDIVLTNADRCIVIDAKYYETPRVAGPYDNKKRLRPEHLNQLFAYLQNAPTTADAQEVEGILVYAQSGDSFDLRFDLLGARCRALTLDLEAEWPIIHSRILELTDSPPK